MAKKFLESFLDFLAAFFSFEVMAGFFFPSLLLFRSLVMAFAPGPDKLETN
jgi:hypothetical protein